MSSSIHSDLPSTKSQSNLSSNHSKDYSFNDHNIQINIAYSSGKPLHLKNVILKAEEQNDFNDALVRKKQDTYSNQNTFKWLEYVDPRKIPVAMLQYFKNRYDIVTTSKLSSQFFLEKLIKQQRYMLVHCKPLGKYLLIYYRLNVECGSGETHKLCDILEKLEIKAVEINIAGMLIEVYKNSALLLKRKLASEIKNEFHEVDNLEHIEDHADEPNSKNVPNYGYSDTVSTEALRNELKEVTMRMSEIVALNNTLLEQNRAIREQNEMILRLLGEKNGM